MKNKQLLGLIMGFTTTLLIYFLVSLSITTDNPSVVDTDRAAYNATCLIDTGSSTGTGVLLDTGFILTAAHVVDNNNNSKIDDNEREVEIKFSPPGSKKYKARVILIESVLDYAILQPSSKIHSDISLQLKKPLIGSELYSYGHPASEGIHLSKGYKSGRTSPSNHHERTTLSLYYGNSGGGVFQKEKVVGIAVSVKIVSNSVHGQIVMPMYLKDGKRAFAIGSVYLIDSDILPNWSNYIGSDIIYYHATTKNLGWTILKEDESISYNIPLYRAPFQILFILIFITLFRRELFN